MNRHDARNAILNATGETLFGLKTSLVASATVLTVLLRRYGASERMIGGIVSIETAACLVPQLLGVYVFASRRRLKAHLILWHMLAMLPFILFMGLLTFRADRMSPVAYRWLLLGGWAAYCLGIGVVAAAWLDFLAHIFHSGIRGTAMGMASSGAAIAGTGAALLSGWMIRTYPAPQVFGWLYVMAWAFGTVSMCLWMPVDDRGAREAQDNPPPPLRTLLARFRESLSDGNFRSFLVGRMLMVLGFSILPFIALYYRSQAGGALTDSAIVSCGAAITLGGAFGALLLGRMGDRFGHRVGILCGTVMQIAALLTLVLGAGQWACIFSYAFAGLAMAGGVPQNNLIFDTCPHAWRTAHIAVTNLVIGGSMALVPLAGGFVAEFCGLRWLFGLSLLFSALALGWFALFFKEPRKLEACAES